MEHYVTLFDAAFLPQGLALHRSLQRHAGAHTLWVLCVDAAAFDVLTRLAAPNVRPIRIEQVESDALRRAKADRTRAEYCWTLTPQAPRFVLDAEPSAARVTYVDADFWFRKSPAPIFEEFDTSGKSVLITEHAYAPDYDQSATSGQYCVQFISFRRGAGERVLDWWAERCIEWCYARFENNRFGDQKYLDDWPERFADAVHVLQRLDWILTPWNASRFPYGPAIAYHFHNLRLLKGGRVMLARGYDVPRATQLAVYQPYLQELSAALRSLAEVGHTPRPQAVAPNPLIQAGILVRKLQRALSKCRPIVTARLPPPDQDGRA
jgi:hypothetical protein